MYLSHIGVAVSIGIGILGLLSSAAVYFLCSRRVKVLRDEMLRMDRTSVGILRTQIVDEVREEMQRSNRSLFSSVERVTDELRDEVDRRFGLLNAKVPEVSSDDVCVVKDEAVANQTIAKAAPCVLRLPVDSRAVKPIDSRVKK